MPGEMLWLFLAYASRATSLDTVRLNRQHAPAGGGCGAWPPNAVLLVLDKDETQNLLHCGAAAV